MASRAALPDLDFEAMTAEEILALLLDEFPGRVSLACSFQKEESVLLDMLFGLEPKARVFALDTHFLFPETYEVWREVERRYGTKIEVFEGPCVGEQAARTAKLWETQPDLCCAIRKVEPLDRALADLDAWITGIRRDQSPTRANAPKVGWDERARALEGEPARRLGRRALLGLHPRARAPLQPAARPRLRRRSAARTARSPGEGREGRWAGRRRRPSAGSTSRRRSPGEARVSGLRRLVHRPLGRRQVHDRRRSSRAELEARGLLVDTLDGDVVREHLSKGLGFSKEDRDTNIARIGWVASRLARAGAAVVVSAISPYEETRATARALVEEHAPFVEVYVATSVEECARRDPKGLYAKALRGRDRGVHRRLRSVRGAGRPGAARSRPRAATPRSESARATRCSTRRCEELEPRSADGASAA